MKTTSVQSKAFPSPSHHLQTRKLSGGMILASVLLIGFSCKAARCAWQTDGPSSNWSNPNNWLRYTNAALPYEGYPSVPQNGDDLVFREFTQVGSDPDTMNNDMNGLVVNSMQFGATTVIAGTLAWRLTGNPITISSQTIPPFSTYQFAIKNVESDPVKVHVDCPLILQTDAFIVTGGCPQAGICPGEGDDFLISLEAPINLNGHNLKLQCNTVHYPALENSNSRIDVKDAIFGNGSVQVVLQRQNVVEFSSPTGNSFSGILNVSGELQSELILNVGSGAAFTNYLDVGGDLVTVKMSGSDQVGDDATVGLGSRTSLKMNGYSDTIKNLYLKSDTVDPDPSTVDTGGGTLTVGGAIFCENNNPAVIPTITGRLHLSSGEHGLHLTGAAYYGLDLQAEVSGLGNITKTGNAGLLLQASNSFSGNLYIEEGLVEVRHPKALGSVAGYTSIEEGALVLKETQVIGEQLRANGRGTGGELPGAVLTAIGLSGWSGEVVLNTNLVVTTSGDMELSGPIGGGGGLAFYGGGFAALLGNLPNTYTGTTLVRCSQLLMNKTAGLDAFAGPLIVGGAGSAVEVKWLNSFQCTGAGVTIYENGLLNLNNMNEDLGLITLHGGTIQTGTAELGLLGQIVADTSTAQSTISGIVRLPPGVSEFHIVDNAVTPDLLVDATVVGTGNLGKFGPGQMWLTGANTYGGATIIYEGTLLAGSPSALGSSTVGTSITGGGTLSLNSINGQLLESISFGGSGTLDIQSSTTLRNQFPSIYPCLSISSNATLHVEPGLTLTMDGFINGTGPLIKTGGGSLVLSNSNPNTYTGDTIVLGGTVELRKPNGAVSIPGALTLGPASSGAPAVLRFYQSGGLPTSTPTVNAYSLLDLNGYNHTVSLLTLNDGGDVQTGAGTLFLADFSSIQVGSLNPLGPSASASISGNLWPPDAASATINVAQYRPSAPIGLPPELEIPANIIGAPSGFPSTLNKDGPGTARFSGNNTTFQGRLRVNGGTLIAANASIFGTTSANTGVNNNGRLALEGNFTVTSESLLLNSTNSAALESRSGTQTWNGPFSLTQGSGISVSQSLTIPTAITGTGNLSKRGVGRLTFSGSANNTYSGNTIVVGGTLALAKPYGYLSVPSNLIIGQPGGPAVTARYENHDQVWADITVYGNGLLDLNGWDEYAGNLTLNEGGDVQTGTGALYVLGTSGVTVNPGNDNPSVISGRLGFDLGSRTINVGSGTSIPGMFDLDIPAVIFQANPPVNLTKSGNGRARFRGNNTYTGTTTVSGGLLQIDGQQSQSPVQVAGARLQGSGAIGNVTLAGGSDDHLAPGGSPGILTCGNLSANVPGGGTLEIELNGITPGTGGYDVLNVQGTVNLAGLGLSASLGFAPPGADQFVIINNDGSDAVVGTFSGLPQDASLLLGGEEFSISYSGGDGNDVVLSRIYTPPPPTLYIESVSPSLVRLFWATNDPDFQLQYCTNAILTNWIMATPLPSIEGKNYVVTNATSGVEYASAVTPVVWYRLGEDDPGAINGGTVSATTTESIDNRHLTRAGAPLYTSAVSTNAAENVGSGLAIQFNGSNQYLNNAVIPTPINNFGIEAWVKPDSTSSGNHIIAYNGNSGANGWGFYRSGLNFFGLLGGVNNVGATVAQPGTWTHLALVRDNGVSTLYANGILQGSFGGAPNTPAPLFAIGTTPAAPGSQLFDGAIDEVRVFTFAPGKFTTNDLLLNRAAKATVLGPTRFYRLHKP